MSPDRGRVILSSVFKGAAVVVVLCAGIGIFAILKATKPTPVVKDRSETVLPVRLLIARPVSIARPWVGYGTARPVRAANVSAEVAGVVIARSGSTEEGVWVEKGEVLVQLDPAEYEARVVTAEQSIKVLEQEFVRLDVDEESLDEQLRLTERAVELIEWEHDQLESAASSGGAARVELERVRRELVLVQRTQREIRGRRQSLPAERTALEAQVEVAKSTLRLAQLDLDRCTIRAPIAGSLQEVTVDTGDRLNVGSPVARIVDVESIEVPIRLPVSAGADIRVGSIVELESRGGNRMAWQATVSRIAPEADPATRTMIVFTVVEQPATPAGEPRLVPGQFVRAIVRSNERSARIVVPRGAVAADRVMIADESNRARPRSVRVDYFANVSIPELDSQETEWAVLVSGLVMGDRVITSNLDELAPGMKVNPIGAPDSEATEPSRASHPSDAAAEVQLKAGDSAGGGL